MTHTHNRGFTLFISIVITATLLLVATSIVAVAVREAFITSASRESQYAFYAADTGAECAIYWDVKGGGSQSAFATSTTQVITCNNSAPQTVGGATGISQFQVSFSPEPYCAVVTVTKNSDGTTKIESLGYNTCDTSNPRRAQRAVRVTY